MLIACRPVLHNSNFPTLFLSLSRLHFQERYKTDMSVAIQLLQCKPDSFVSPKLSTVRYSRQLHRISATGWIFLANRSERIVGRFKNSISPFLFPLTASNRNPVEGRHVHAARYQLALGLGGQHQWGGSGHCQLLSRPASIGQSTANVPLPANCHGLFDAGNG